MEQRCSRSATVCIRKSDKNEKVAEKKISGLKSNKALNENSDQRGKNAINGVIRCILT